MLVHLLNCERTQKELSQSKRIANVLHCPRLINVIFDLLTWFPVVGHFLNR